jgi:hypothetical protein
MSLAKKVLESKDDLANLQNGDKVITKTLGEVVFYSHSIVNCRSLTKTLCFIKEKSATEIEFYRSLRDMFDVVNNQVIFPKHLDRPSFTFEEKGAFSGDYEIARQTLNKAYNTSEKKE